ncbi:MAG: flippase activity-associated protein Agl23 [Planctomycetota bacterium]
MRWQIKFWFFFSAVFILAMVLRTLYLNARPMHGDEAVHAYKFGQLLEHNDYRYDPYEFHGPTLNYFTLIPALFSGRHTYASLTESTLRIVPALFGLLVVIMPILLVRGLGRPVALIAAALTAISPAFVFYSRYYIPEMLLVCFTFGVIAAGYQYAGSRKTIWALFAGLFAGLCYATKETCIIAFGSMLLALLAVWLIHNRNSSSPAYSPRKIKPAHLVAAAFVAICVSALFFSSFFKNPAGVLDSFRAYSTYLGRAGTTQLHIHPWFYYLKLLVYSKAVTGPAWTEGFVVVLAVVGIVLIVAGKGISKLDRRLLDFLVFYTVISLAVYSAIPYKTPWCLLSFYYGMILLAGVGVVAMINLSGRMLTRVIIVALIVTFATDLGLQSILTGFASDVDFSNPYVYAHPAPDVLKITQRIEQVSNTDQSGRQMTVLVVCPDGDYWPLPWYLRSFPNVGWYNDVNEIKTPAPVVIAAAQLESELITKLYDLSPPGQKNLYVPLFDNYIELRPQVELRGYITKDLWDKWQSNISENRAAR